MVLSVASPEVLPGTGSESLLAVVAAALYAGGVSLIRLLDHEVYLLSEGPGRKYKCSHNKEYTSLHKVYVVPHYQYIHSTCVLIFTCPVKNALHGRLYKYGLVTC